MIKFFRKIRQKLLEQSKIRSYFVYAFGEIVLVVIGILIALQINNWNDNRITKTNALKVSKRLLNETKNNQKELALFILRVDKSKECAVQLLKRIGKDYQKQDEHFIDSLLLGTYSVYNYDFNTAVLDKVLSSGELSSIKNDSIEVFMYQIKTLQKGYELSENLLIQHINENIATFWNDKISMRKIDFQFSKTGKDIGDSQLEKIDNRAILGNLIFENIINDSYYLLTGLQRRYNELNNKLSKLIHAIEQQTKNQ
ncbi:hypothetical protein IU405_12285 [Polaribacter sp. BAL334]|uniref:DUF6090 family protein n=1 Tax=Polaribacter sp. BAL334 TaxID=1708178 RepID=UPI0018D220CB|nr:DUF6090 family protein [Polaribacter sp. BAL334]MBG7613026.1 hypothetical protein [Polaribacter sp. BAL334]